MGDVIRIVEVGPRDGLQNEKIPLSTEVKARFISDLVEAGLNEIEVSSFVSPKWVPQLADAADLLQAIPEGPLYSTLVPNDKGLQRALACGVERIAVFTAASDDFTQKNINMTVNESLEVFDGIVSGFRTEKPTGHVRGYVSTAFECPYAGKVEPSAVAKVVARLMEIGVNEISLGDTIGVAVPDEVRSLSKAIEPVVNKDMVAWHFHDTRGTAISNVAASLELGYTAFDSSAGGLGGCPYAPGAGGNLATEDLVYFLERSGHTTGVDPEKLAKASLPVLEVLGRSPASKAQLATLSHRPVC